MLDKLKWILPLAIIIITLIIGIIGYLQKDFEGQPVNVLFRTKGGAAVFTHKKHALVYGLECQKCHHNFTDGLDKISKCRTCHSKGTDYSMLCSDDAIHKECIAKNCIKCHQEMMGNDGKDCTYCHKQ